MHGTRFERAHTERTALHCISYPVAVDIGGHIAIQAGPWESFQIGHKGDRRFYERDALNQKDQHVISDISWFFRLHNNVKLKPVPKYHLSFASRPVVPAQGLQPHQCSVPAYYPSILCHGLILQSCFFVANSEPVWVPPPFTHSYTDSTDTYRAFCYYVDYLYAHAAAAQFSKSIVTILSSKIVRLCDIRREAWENPCTLTHPLQTKESSTISN
jgi:hypothetical protein